MNQPTLISLFTGAGGLDIGLEQAGFETIFANEIEPYACESLRANQALQVQKSFNFDQWFEKQITEQRCYKSVSPSEIDRLRERLYSVKGGKPAFLRNAAIVEGDIRALSGSDVLNAAGVKRGTVSLVAGGPPCQPFSRAGKREVVESEAGQLFLDFVRMVDAIRPRWFLFENVKGLVLHKADVASLRCDKCHNKKIVPFRQRASLKEVEYEEGLCGGCGNVVGLEVLWEKRKAGSLDIITSEFESYGYKCKSIVLDAADYGAPQHRERLFIVGSRDGEQFEWPKPTHSAPSSKKQVVSLFDYGRKPLPEWRTLNEALYKNGHWHYGPLDQNTAVLWVKNVVRPHDEPVTWSLNRPAPTIGAHQSAKLAIAPRGVPPEQLFRQQWHTLGRRQSDTPPVYVEHEYLTDQELLKLQTFPDAWYLFGTRMQRAFQIGNAVPPVLAKAVGEQLMNAMGAKSSSDEKIRDYNEQRNPTRI